MPTQRIDPEIFLMGGVDGRAVATHRPGSVIYKQGEPATFVYYLRTGRAKETIVSDQGKQVVVNMLEAGRFFGISGIFNSHIRNTTVTILMPSVVIAVSHEDMLAALNEPRFARYFMDYLIQQNNAMEAQKADLLLSSKSRRLAHTLVTLAQAGDDERLRVIGAEITQEMLAAMTGMTRPYVNAILNRFRERGFIRYNGGIMVLPALLDALRQPNDPA